MNNKNIKPPEVIKIEADIPIPEGRARTGKWKETLMKLNIRDSMFVSISQSRCVYQAARMLGIKMTQRKIEDGIRMWRVE